MNYEKLLRKLRQDPRIFDTSDSHKIHRVLLNVKDRMIQQREKALTGAQRDAQSMRSILRANPSLTALDFA